MFLQEINMPLANLHTLLACFSICCTHAASEFPVLFAGASHWYGKLSYLMSSTTECRPRGFFSRLRKLHKLKEAASQCQTLTTPLAGNLL